MKNKIIKPIAYLWGLLLGGLFMLYTFAAALVLAVLSLFITRRKFYDWYVGHVWAGVVLKVCRVKVDVRGLENIKSNGGLLLFNHSSNFDILALFYAFPKVRFGAKAELYRVPFLARSMRVIGILPIYRRERKRVLEVYKQAHERMREGEFFALAPEGTRLSIKSVGSFKNGPFVFAAGAQGTIYPVVLHGAQDVMAANSPFVNPGRFSGRIIVQVLEPISTANVDPCDVSEIRDLCQSKMFAAYERLSKEKTL